jgi:hypothetical protein
MVFEATVKSHMDPNNPVPTDDDLDMMLGAGRLGGPAKDRIFDAVARQTQPRRSRWFSTGVFLAAGFGAAAVAFVVVARRPVDTLAGDTFASKGAGAPSSSLEISCAGGALTGCRLGSRVLFSVAGAESGYLAAFAERAAGGPRIWYFSGDGESPRIGPNPGTQVVTRAILLGPEHEPGDYTVHVLLTPRPLSRAQLAQSPEVIAQRQFGLRIVVP